MSTSKSCGKDAMKSAVLESCFSKHVADFTPGLSEASFVSNSVASFEGGFSLIVSSRFRPMPWPWIQLATDKSSNGRYWQAHSIGHMMEMSSHFSQLSS